MSMSKREIARKEKLLIIHADDLGMSHSVNLASFKALDKGIVTSASVMVNCPWFAEVAEFAKTRPHLDLGVHITLTSEWSAYRWRPILGVRARSLINREGYLHSSVDDFIGSVRLTEMKREIRAQIETALSAGIEPSHLDSHMHANGYNSLIYAAFSEVARDFRLPHIAVTYRREKKRKIRRREAILSTVPHILQASPHAAPTDWDALYSGLLEGVTPGLHQLTVHVGFNEPELEAITRDRTDWNASWRQRDLDVLDGCRFKESLEKLGIKLTSWREVFPKGAPYKAMDGATTERPAIPNPF